MDIYKIVKGNAFTLHIQMKKVRSVQNKQTLDDVYFPNVVDLRVAFNSFCGHQVVIPTNRIRFSSDSEIFVTFPNNLDLGVYGIEITGVYDGYDFCCREKRLFKIVSNNGKSSIPLGLVSGERGGFYQASYWIELEDAVDSAFRYGASSANNPADLNLSHLRRAQLEDVGKSLMIETTDEKSYIWFVSKSALSFTNASFTASLNHREYNGMQYYWTDELVPGNDNEYRVYILE